MGKSPGKWIKTLLFGKKSARSHATKGRDAMVCLGVCLHFVYAYCFCSFISFRRCLVLYLRMIETNLHGLSSCCILIHAPYFILSVPDYFFSRDSFTGGTCTNIAIFLSFLYYKKVDPES